MQPRIRGHDAYAATEHLRIKSELPTNPLYSVFTAFLPILQIRRVAFCKAYNMPAVSHTPFCLRSINASDLPFKDLRHHNEHARFFCEPTGTPTALTWRW